MPTIWLQEQTWSDIETYLKKDDRILLPIGSTEQHGRFAPLGTDTYVAISLAEDVSAKLGVLAAPPPWYGWSPHITGNPTASSAEKGKRYHEHLVKRLSQVLEELKD